MVGDRLLARARAVWVDLAGVPVAFPADGKVEVVASAGSRLCPPGWIGIVALGGAAIVTVPTDSMGATVHAALETIPLAAVTEPDRLRAVLPIVEVLGPASLAYLDERDFRPAEPSAVPTLAADHPDIAGLLALASTEDAGESGLAEITSPAFVARDQTCEVKAAAGYRLWPGNVGHMCVLTAPAWRGRGLARVVAGAAVGHALAHQLLPQWRARPEPSRRVAWRLGFRQLGIQLSIRVGFSSPPS